MYGFGGHNQGKGCLRHKKSQSEKIKRLTDKEEIELISKYKNTHDDLVIHTVITNKLPLIKSKARKRLKNADNPVMIFDDLIGGGVLGLIQAIHKFEPDIHKSFSEFADEYIESTMCREQDRFNSTKIPRHLWKLFKHIKKETCINCHRRCSY